jgi:hypothetical protein
LAFDFANPHWAFTCIVEEVFPLTIAEVWYFTINYFHEPQPKNGQGVGVLVQSSKNMLGLLSFPIEASLMLLISVQGYIVGFVPKY